jgi:hypothetical protein
VPSCFDVLAELPAARRRSGVSGSPSLIILVWKVDE